MRRNVAQVKTQMGTYNIERNWESGIYVTRVEDASGITLKEEISDDPESSLEQFRAMVIWSATQLMAKLPTPAPPPAPAPISYSLPDEATVFVPHG